MKTDLVLTLESLHEVLLLLLACVGCSLTSSSPVLDGLRDGRHLLSLHDRILLTLHHRRSMYDLRVGSAIVMTFVTDNVGSD